MVEDKDLLWLMIVILVHGHWPPCVWEYGKGARGWWWLMAECTQFMTTTTTTTAEQNWGPNTSPPKNARQ